MRTPRIVLAAVSTVLLATVAAGPAQAAAGTPAVAGPAADRARAAETYTALSKNFLAGDGSGLVHEQYPVQDGDNAYSYEWPYSQVHAAALDLTGVDAARYRPELAARDAGQEHYWNPSAATGLPGYDSYPRAPYGSGGDLFYDDNEWVGLIKVQQYLQTGDKQALARAEQIFDLAVSGWDTDASHPDPGGVFWTQASYSRDRNTVSNMPAAEIGLRLYLITGQERYLTWSKKMYDWTKQNLQAPSGLYYDHVDLQGTVNTAVWSYNQGVPVGVNVLLYRATHDRKYLTEAKRIADAAEQYYSDQQKQDAQGVTFNTIYYKNLLLLDDALGTSTYRKSMSAYAERLWTTKRDAATGLFHFDANGRTQAVQQASAAQLYAVLAWPRSTWKTLY